MGKPSATYERLMDELVRLETERSRALRDYQHAMNDAHQQLLREWDAIERDRLGILRTLRRLAPDG